MDMFKKVVEVGTSLFRKISPLQYGFLNRCAMVSVITARSEFKDFLRSSKKTSEMVCSQDATPIFNLFDTWSIH